MDVANNPLQVKYIIRRVPRKVTFQFNRFRMIADGCVYDSVNYLFTGNTVNLGVPWFVQQEPSELNFSISMNDTTAEGTYTMNLFGSLNPYLNLSHKFFLEMEVYPNTAAPSFVKQLE
jgi:hypothetical protein